MFTNVSPLRQKTMKAIKCKNTCIELKIRQELWRRGIRGYRINYSKVIGKPDIAFIGKKIAIFCDSEFWHGKKDRLCKNKCKTNKEYWNRKIKRNISRDKIVNKSLKKEGWIVLRFWANEINKNKERCIDIILSKVKGNINV